MRVEFLTATGPAMDQRPLWLFWSGSRPVPLEALWLMYWLRFGLEHFFRFAQQRLGWLIAQTPDLAASMTWVWVVALASTQLLLARTGVVAQPRPWDPKSRRDPQRPLTPGQVRQAWPAFSHGLGTPAQAQRKITGTLNWFPAQAAAPLSGGLQEAKASRCRLGIGLTPVEL
jgi:hypothetical protein